MLLPEPTHAVAGAETYGAYRPVRLLGEGASGRVFLAERTDFAQRVALKVFHSAFVTVGLHGENSHKAQPVVSLDHRHIVRVLQQGTTPGGVRYLAMEYVDGDDILTFCDTRRLALAARVRLLGQVLGAVDHAHRHLVVHGDLKPANVLVTAEGDAPTAKLVDFGAAVRLGQHPDDETTTAHTPAFASPEQRAGARTTVASDIYSLGLLARQLLAGIPPGQPTGELASRAVLRLAGSTPRATSPPAEARATTPAQLAAALRGDLDAFLRKALETDPDARYLTAAAMAADLRAYTEGRTLAARHAPFAERLRKWTLRHKLAAAMAAVLLFALLFSAIGIAIQAAHARRSRRQAEARLRELVQLTGTLQSELYGSVRPLAGAADSEKLLTDTAATTLDKLAAAGPTDPSLRAELADQYAQLANLELEQAQVSIPTPPGGRPAARVRAVRHLQSALALTPPGDPHRAQWEHLLAQLQRA